MENNSYYEFTIANSNYTFNIKNTNPIKDKSKLAEIVNRKVSKLVKKDLSNGVKVW